MCQKALYNFKMIQNEDKNMGTSQKTIESVDSINPKQLRYRVHLEKTVGEEAR